MTKSRLYIFELHYFTPMADHCSFIHVLNNYTLDVDKKVAPYIFTAVHCARKRAFHTPYTVTHLILEYDKDCTVITAHIRPIDTSTIMVMEPIIDADRTLHTDATQYPAYSCFLSYISNGFPTNRYDLHVFPYWNLWVRGKLLYRL